MKNFADRDPPDIDRIIGERVRMCRKAHQMSQKDLAVRVGVAWQQIQKYEYGKNRVSASMLWKISEIFDLPVSYFFEDVSCDMDLEDKEESFPALRKDKVAEMYSWLGEEEKDAVYSFLKSVAGQSRIKEVAE